MVDDIAASIGDKIKKLRTEKNLSIQKLADMADVSPAGIYKIESSGMTPSITTLMKIAKALDKRVSFFIGEDASVKDAQVIKAAGRVKEKSNREGITIESIGGRLDNVLIQGYLFSIEPGSSSSETSITHGGEEIGICLEGDIEYTIRDGVFTISEGDSIHIKGEVPHRWVNKGNRRARLLLIVSPPPFPSEGTYPG